MKKQIIEALKNDWNISFDNIETLENYKIADGKVNVYSFFDQEEYEITKEEFIKIIEKLNEKFLSVKLTKYEIDCKYVESEDFKITKNIEVKDKLLIDYFIEQLNKKIKFRTIKENNLNAQYFFRLKGKDFNMTIGYITYCNRIEIYAPTLFKDIIVLFNKEQIDNVIDDIEDYFIKYIEKLNRKILTEGVNNFLYFMKVKNNLSESEVNILKSKMKKIENNEILLLKKGNKEIYINFHKQQLTYYRKNNSISIENYSKEEFLILSQNLDTETLLQGFDY